jgi:hypothetical protein
LGDGLAAPTVAAARQARSSVAITACALALAFAALRAAVAALAANA